MSTTRTSKLFSVGNMTRMAILTALASILFILEIPIFPPIYKLDLSNVCALLGAFSMGTVPGLIILGLKSVIGLLHSSSAGVGELADFIMGAALVIPASMVYHHQKTRKNAILGMLAGTACIVVFGVLVNKWIMIPFYLGTNDKMTMESICAVISAKNSILNVNSEWQLLLFATAPFNLIKGVVLSVVTALIYKPLSPLLHEKIR